MTKFGACFLLCFIAFADAVVWPSGTYTLVKPKTGCPSGWSEGWRNQDNEDKNNKNGIAQGHHFFVLVEISNSTIAQETPMNGVLDRGGPQEATVYLDMEDFVPRASSVYWDDEDSRNKNSHGGTLPSGAFDRNTRIDYCCRNDGSYRRGISLPTSRPFYLLRYTSYCQNVRGMQVREEFVRFDDEDRNNKNSVSGRPPWGAGGRNHQLLYCYYWR